MVGIVLASHGGFADGILESSFMIFGEQENVKAVTLQRSENPEQVKKKMEQAIKTFKDQDEVLFLVDLWGGTPFNQANGLFEQHKKSWSIVSGFNLPMLLSAFELRMTMTSAQEIANNLLIEAVAGIRSKPEVLAGDQKSQTKEIARPVNSSPLPEGTVVGDGKIKFVLARVDTRLLHGQVATAWTKSTRPNRIIVVSDQVSQDDLRKKLIMQAAPPEVKANVIPIQKLIEISKDPRFGNTKALLLFETPQDALRVIEAGVDIKVLNIGSMSHSVGKIVINKVLSMDKDDVKTIEKLKALKIKFDMRKVPNDSSENMEDLLRKAKAELKI